MYVLIVDDDPSKCMSIKQDILACDESAEIGYCDDYSKTTNFLLNNNIDLLILDWSFPINSGERVQYGVGKMIIDWMRINGMSVRTIICSPNEFDINNDKYPFILGSIYYDGTSIENNLRTLLNLPNKTTTDKGIARCIKKPTTGRYERRLSSTPWWRQ